MVAPLTPYVPAVRTADLVFTSSQLPMVDGALVAVLPLHAPVEVELVVQVTA